MLPLSCNVGEQTAMYNYLFSTEDSEGEEWWPTFLCCHELDGLICFKLAASRMHERWYEHFAAWLKTYGDVNSEPDM